MFKVYHMFYLLDHIYNKLFSGSRLNSLDLNIFYRLVYWVDVSSDIGGGQPRRFVSHQLYYLVRSTIQC